MKSKETNNKNLEQEEEIITYKQYDIAAAQKTSKRLRECRERLKYSQEDMADLNSRGKFPVKYEALKNYEMKIDEFTKRSNIKGMKLKTFYELCMYYDVSADYLLGFTRSRHTKSTVDYLFPPKGRSCSRKNADYRKMDLGIKDDTIDVLKYLNTEPHNQILLPKGYNEISGCDFVNFMICHLAKRLISYTRDYFDTVSSFEEFKDKYCDPKTGNLKKGIDYIGDFANDYQEAEYAANAAKFSVMQVVERFLDELREELLIKDDKNKK